MAVYTGPRQGLPSWKDILVLHAEFHAEAARVLDLALDGKKAEATSALATGSRFADTSCGCCTRSTATTASPCNLR